MNEEIIKCTTIKGKLGQSKAMLEHEETHCRFSDHASDIS